MTSRRDRLPARTPRRRLTRERRRDPPPVRTPELERAIARSPDREAVLVHETVVEAAEQHQVLLARRAAVGPVADVMGVEVVPTVAARKAAVPVSTLEHGPQRSRDHASLAAVVQRAILGPPRDDDLGVAPKPPGRLRGNRRA